MTTGPVLYLWRGLGRCSNVTDGHKSVCVRGLQLLTAVPGVLGPGVLGPGVLEQAKLLLWCLEP